MRQASRRVFPRVFALSVAALLPACKSVEVPKVPGVTPYRMVIQQGNFISQEMVAQLKPGMTREQVRFVLGTPLVTDIFHADRWDYVFFRELPNGKREQRNLSVVFEKDKLARVLGDLMSPEGAAVQSTGFAPQVKPDAPAKPAAAAKEDEKKAAAQKKAAEEKRAAEERRAAEEKRLAEEMTLAEEKRAAEEKKAADAKKAAEEKRAAQAKQAGEEKKELGFFGRLLERITPAKPADPKADVKPVPDVAAATKTAAEPAKPAEAPKERGFFGRMLEKVGL